MPKINAKGGVNFFKEIKINATYKKKRKLFKQQEPIYLKLTEIQEADVESNILLTATMKMKCCYSNQFVKDWSEILKVRETKAIKNVWSRSRILG